MNRNIPDVAKGKPAFFRLVRHPFKYRLFLLTRLPAAYFAGLKVREADDEHCAVSVPFKWFTQNPFRSTYFACLSMAAEMSTGILVMANIYQRRPTASMLITAMEAVYHKKAKGTTLFICRNGKAIEQAIEETYQTSEGRTIKVKSTGYNEQQEVVAEFWFSWSVRVKL